MSGGFLSRLVISASGVDEGLDRKDTTPVALMNGEQLVVFLVENRIGIECGPYELIELEGKCFHT